MDNGFYFVGVTVCDRVGVDSLGRDPEGGGDGAGELSGKTGRVGGAERGFCGDAGEVWEQPRTPDPVGVRWFELFGFS